jgi:TPR repeat protein
LLLFNGQGVGKRTLIGRTLACPAKAFFYAQQSAEQGNSDGLVLLGSVYLHGEGCAIDTLKAFDYYTQAAEKVFLFGGLTLFQGHKHAMHFLSLLYQDGGDLEVDLVKAFIWTKAAADGGLKLSMQNLADMYRDGRGCVQNEREADRWEEILVMPRA